MVRFRWVAVLVPIALLLSGCAGKSAETKQEDLPDAAPPEADASTGAIAGTVTDDTLAPIAGATAAILDTELSATTDEAGQFTFSKLPPGAAKVAVQKIGYESTVRVVQIAAGEVKPVAITLTALAIVEPYYVTQQGEGRIGCGVGARAPSPVGATAFEACASTYGTPLNTTDNFRVDFTLTAENSSLIKSLVFETTWRSTQATASGLDVLWENYQDWGAGSLYTEDVHQFAEVFGRSPLKTVADEDAIQAVAKASPPLKYCKFNGPCKIYARTFPYADTLGSSNPVDFSLYADQRFTHLVTEFFGEPAPESFTALADT